MFLQNYEIRPFNVGCAEHSSMIVGLNKEDVQEYAQIRFEPTVAASTQRHSIPAKRRTVVPYRGIHAEHTASWGLVQDVATGS